MFDVKNLSVKSTTSDNLHIKCSTVIQMCVMQFFIGWFMF